MLVVGRLGRRGGALHSFGIGALWLLALLLAVVPLLPAVRARLAGYFFRTTSNLEAREEPARPTPPGAEPGEWFSVRTELDKVSVNGSPEILEIAIENIVDNAISFAPRGSTITVTLNKSAQFADLFIDDEGPGIVPAARERVLDAFYRLDPARTAGGAAPAGFGLGLTFARRVAEVHGGGITIGPAAVTDGAEHGCRVTLTVPVGEGA